MGSLIKQPIWYTGYKMIFDSIYDDIDFWVKQKLSKEDKIELLILNRLMLEFSMDNKTTLSIITNITKELRKKLGATHENKSST